MRLAVTLIAAGTAIAGCDAAIDRLASRAYGDKTVVVAPAPITLSKSTIELTSSEPMNVLGHWSLVCLALKGDVAHADSQTMDARFAEATRGSKIEVAVILGDGSRWPLNAPLPAWRKVGAILPNNELSGCAGAGCLPRLPTGAVVAKVLLRAEPDLNVAGIFWSSMPDLPNRPADPTKSTAVTSTERSCG